MKSLIADISHQTKTPIANLLLYAQMLEERSLPAEERAFVQEISRQSQKLSFLITSLVKASRLETEMLVLHVKLYGCVTDAGGSVRQIAPKAAQSS